MKSFKLLLLVSLFLSFSDSPVGAQSSSSYPISGSSAVSVNPIQPATNQQFGNLFNRQGADPVQAFQSVDSQIAAPIFTRSLESSSFQQYGSPHPLAQSQSIESLGSPNFQPNREASQLRFDTYVPQQHDTLLAKKPDIMDVKDFRLWELRRLFKTGRTPTREELVGYWRGANRGIVELVGYKQFIKEIHFDGAEISGDNIQVGQVGRELYRTLGWQPLKDSKTGQVQRRGKYAIQPPSGRGTFGKGIVFNYREGGNDPSDPANLLVDRVVVIGPNHLLGRATAKFGPVEIPLAYFVLERIQSNQ